jgi:nitrite reductase/ring-hydroxylating ferredoxin subunit
MWLGCALPCACLAGASRDCCTLAEAPAGAVRFERGAIVLEAGALPATGDALKIVDEGRKVQVLVARTGRRQFVALDQRCTHGGGALTYVHKQKHLYCTCWGHAKFALDGSVIRWPNKQTPKPLRAYRVEQSGTSLRILVDGVA